MASLLNGPGRRRLIRKEADFSYILCISRDGQENTGKGHSSRVVHQPAQQRETVADTLVCVCHCKGHFYA